MKFLLLSLLIGSLVYGATPSVSVQHFDGLKVGDKSAQAASAIVDIKSTTQGLLVPRMSAAQMNAISSPATGLMVYNTTAGVFCSYTGAAWYCYTAGASVPLNPNVAVITDAGGALASGLASSTQSNYLQYLTAAGGDIVYTTNYGLLGLAPGTSGQLLQSNGTNPPSWVTQLSGPVLSALTIPTTQVSNNATYYPGMFSNSANITQGADIALGLTFNPSTDVLTTTTFSGALSGNATSATTATTATNSVNEATTNTSTNATYYPTFVSSTSNSNQALNLTTGFSVNPSTDVVTATTFNGNLAASNITGILPLANGGTNNNLTAAGGDIVYTDSTKMKLLANGTSGYVLTSNGGTNAPSWQQATGGGVSAPWSTYTMTVTATSSNPTKGTVLKEIAAYNIVGKMLFIKYNYRQGGAGSAGTGTYLYSLPPGVTIDTTYIEASTGLDIAYGGCGVALYDNGVLRTGAARLYDSTHIALGFLDNTSTYNDFNSSVFSAYGLGTIYLSFDCLLPIQ